MKLKYPDEEKVYEKVNMWYAKESVTFNKLFEINRSP